MKQDRNGVRTAQDLERKYDFSSIDTLKENYELQKTGLNKVENELNNFVIATTQNIEELQNQVDGNITTWFSSGIPTLNNYPANEWTDIDTKNNHLGDLYYDKNTGYAYRFTLEENIYKWIELKDNDVTEALAIANAAQDTADSKRRVFVSQPSPPYDVGDLWLNNQELYRCQTTKATGAYESNDWIIATKYTDDTVANQVGNNLTILSGTVTEIIEDVDELSTTITNTTTLVNEHGEEIGTLQQQQSSTSQTVNQISASLTTVSNRVDAQGNTITNLSDQLNPTDTSSGSSINLDDSSNAELIDFELEGKTEQDGTPTPSNPIELESVGYKNLFDRDTMVINAALNAADGVLSSSDNFRTIYVPVESDSLYVIQKIPSNRFVIGYSNDYSTTLPKTLTNVSSYSTDRTELILTTPSNIKTIFIMISKISEDTTNIDDLLNSIQVEEGTMPHGVIPYNKYGVEIKIHNQNLYNYKDAVTVTSGVTVDDDGWITAAFDNTSGSANKYMNYWTHNLDLKPSTNYKIITEIKNVSGTGSVIVASNPSANSGQINGSVGYAFGSLNNNDIKIETKTTKSSFENVSDGIRTYVQFQPGQSGSITFRISVLEDTTITAETFNYVPYDSKIYRYLLDAPLRGIDDTKDLLYIKNGLLYINRKIGKAILTESSTIEYSDASQGRYDFTIPNAKLGGKCLSNYYQYKFAVENGKCFISGATSRFSFCNNTLTSNQQALTWLSSHNTEVIYELSESYIEELGKIQIPGTFKGITSIDSTDSLEPNMNVTYARNTLIANYVESHVNQIKITENGIEQRVQTIEDGDYGTRINAVEQRTTDTEHSIDIISTNIDTTTGEVRRVTTTTGFTFNEDGMTIEDSNSNFKALHRNTGTTYYDGTDIVGQYTKDGSKQKDLDLFGIYTYGKNDINDTPMFIAQLFTDGNGEEGFGHFYNKG